MSIFLRCLEFTIGVAAAGTWSWWATHHRPGTLILWAFFPAGTGAALALDALIVALDALAKAPA